MFNIQVDERRCLLRVRLTGVLSLEDVAELARAQDRAAKALICPPNAHLMLCDTSNCVLQRQEVVAEFQRLITAAPRRARRLAVVTGSSATRMQVRRILKRDDADVFVTTMEAEAWLFAAHDADTAIDGPEAGSSPLPARTAIAGSGPPLRA